MLNREMHKYFNIYIGDNELKKTYIHASMGSGNFTCELSMVKPVPLGEY